MITHPLRLFLVLDASGAMAGDKITALNFAFRELLPVMREAAASAPHVSVEIQVMTFGSGITWVTPAPVPLAQFTWTDILVGGPSDMGAAMRAISAELSAENMPERSLPPVIVLVANSYPTDDFEGGLNALLSEPWGTRSMRIGVAVGSNADKDLLWRFTGRNEIEPLEASNLVQLVNYIWDEPVRRNR